MYKTRKMGGYPESMEEKIMEERKKEEWKKGQRRRGG
jgi:hypothetical protein